MTRSFSIALAAGVLTLLAAGCYPPTDLDRHFGEAHHQNRQQMVANPSASEARKQADGLDPATAEQALDNYRTRQADVDEYKGPGTVIFGGSD